METTYRLQTIADVFHLVPADRIKDCLSELGQILSETAALRDHIADQCKAAGIEIDLAQVVRLPEYIEWIDDGKGHLQANIGVEHDGKREEVFSIVINEGKP